MGARNDPSEPRVRAFVAVCQQQGLRVTPQRLAVFRELARAHDHPSAETLHRRIRKRLPTVTLDTVYRTLGTLERAGLVVRVSVVGNSQRFEANLARHHHFVCRRCNAIVDVYSPALDQLPIDRGLPEGFVVDSVQVELRGTCSRCATQRNR